MAEQLATDICKLEKKSISITRLKPWQRLSHLRWIETWKEKHLDYEIETRLGIQQVDEVLTWKEKHLDYEIETMWRLLLLTTRLFLKRKASRLRDWNKQIIHVNPTVIFAPWKEKHLDYEIETLGTALLQSTGLCLEKKSISITRLKLKIKTDRDPLRCSLEKKSISITRLKHG